MRSSIRRTLVSMLGVCSVVGCEKKEEEAPSAAPAEDEGPGTMNVKWEPMKLDFRGTKLGGAHAHYDFDREKVEIALYSDTIAGSDDCGFEVESSGKAIESNQLGLSLRLGSSDEPFPNKAGTYENVKYRVYYRKEGKEKGTNSGGSSDNQLALTKVTDDVIEGRFTMKGKGKDFDVKFEAEVCE